MASKFLSPGVFTQEIDQSFLGQGVAGIGAGIIGAAEKGPAFVPVTVGNFDEYYERLGNVNTLMQGPYAAKNYLANNSVLNYVRVLGHNDNLSNVTAGYSVGGMTGICDGTGSEAQVLAVVHHSGTADVISVTGVPGDADKFVFTIGSFGVTASFLTSSAEYVGKTLNTDPTRYSTDSHYLYQAFKYANLPASASWAAVAISGTHRSFEQNYSSGSSTWVRSQPLGGNEFNLFRFHTVGHGRSTNDEIKVCVQNVKPSPNTKVTPYGTFDVVVRKFYDTDQRPEILESFTNLTLDPDSRNFILRRIGDMYEEFDTNERKFVSYGDYSANSKYVRVEYNKNSGAPGEAVPWGFSGYKKMQYNVADTAGDGVSHVIPEIKYVPDLFDVNGNFNENVYWGVSFVSGGVADRMRALPALTEAQETDNTATDTQFSLKHVSSSYETGKLRYYYNTSYTSNTPLALSASLHKFTMPMHGGFDGWDLRVENNLDVANGTGDTDLIVTSLKRAVDCLADPDHVDINLLAVPGVHNLKVSDHARQMVNDRMDAMYVMDLTGATVSTVIEQLQVRELDDNYTAAYYPDLKLNDTINNRVVRIAPSVAVMGAIAFSDRVSQKWFAPAGLNRGGLNQFDIIDVIDRLNYKDRNELYDNKINPIASFPNEGITIWGQKTLQASESALDRVNVRRLLIHAKKTIASAAKYLVFEPNNPATYQRFTNTVNPILEDIRIKQGLERFQVVMDTNLNTPDVVDRNIMRGKIFLQPTKAAEFIDLQFIITNAGVQFAS